MQIPLEMNKERKDRREAIRYTINEPFEARLNSHIHSGIQLLEINPQGLSFILNEEIPLLNKTKLSIWNDQNQELTLHIKPKWKKADTSGSIRYGAMIMHVAFESRKALKRLIAQFDTTRLSDRRSSTRRHGNRPNQPLDRRFYMRLDQIRNSDNYIPNQTKRIVITGIGIASPIGIGRSTFFDSISAQRGGIKFIPSFKKSNFSCFHAGMIENDTLISTLQEYLPYISDHLDREDLVKYFHKLDRPSQIGLVAALDCVHDSGISFNPANRKNFGIIVGTVLGGLTNAFKAHEDYNKQGTHKVDPYTVANSTPNACSGELSGILKLQGPSACISQGCTSGINAVAYASMLIQNNKADIMLAGGTDSPFHETIYASFCRSKMLAPSSEEGPSNHTPLDSNRKGTVLAEGSCFLILEDLAHALSRNATIYAEILSEFQTCDGAGMIKTKWNGDEMARAMGKCLSQASIQNPDVIYAHATGSIESDETELNAIHLLFGEIASEIPITNIKKLIGYSQAACGPLEVATACMGFEKGLIPGIPGFKSASHNVNISNGNRHLKLENALINCFGFGGKNISMLLGKYENKKKD